MHAADHRTGKVNTSGQVGVCVSTASAFTKSILDFTFTVLHRMSLYILVLLIAQVLCLGSSKLPSYYTPTTSFETFVNLKSKRSESKQPLNQDQLLQNAKNILGSKLQISPDDFVVRTA